MVLANLIAFFERDLLKVQLEIELYEQEHLLWEICPGINNSAGNLVLHLVGNLNHFVGATLGNSGYVRQRDDEFALKNIPKEALMVMLKDTISVVTNTLQAMTPPDLDKDFPLEKHGQVVSNTHMLLHLLTHLNYHLGQINYHRRMINSVR